MTRYKITVEYDGTNYCGFQKQINIKTKSIEGCLEKAIFEMSQNKVKIQPSGRTDAGVHAFGQIVHFDLDKEFEPLKVVMAMNNYLRKETIAVLNCEIVNDKFHARYDSKKRYYEYKILNRKAPLTIDKNRKWHVGQNLDIKKMQEGAKFLIGEHDFSSFRGSGCQSKSPIRTMIKIEITQNNEEIIITTCAKSYLHHMIRNIVGTLIYVGINKIKPQEIKTILESKDRTKSGPNAPACGLYFLRVEY